MANRETDAPVSQIEGSYAAASFVSAEEWCCCADEAHAGETCLQGKTWVADFSRGAAVLSLRPRAYTLLGTPVRFVLRVRGTAEGCRLTIHIGTHFMTFCRTSEPLSCDNDHEIVFEAPPGPGWKWYGGENDGQLHGPMRITQLDLLSSGKAEQVELQLFEIRADVVYPAQHSCTLLADCTSGEFTASVRTLRMVPTPAQIRWTVRDWDKNTIAQGEQGVCLPAAAKPVDVAVPVPPGEHNFLEAEFRAEIEGEIVPEDYACYVRPVEGSQGETKLTPDSPFGMGVYLYRYASTPEGFEQMERAAQIAASAGVKWSREEFSWPQIETAPGVLDWDFYDRVVDTAARHGICLYALLTYWPNHIKAYTPQGIGEYCRFVEAAVRRYGKTVRHWEIWNEPNIFFWQGPKDMYAELLKEAYAVIKRLDPDAVVLGCSTAGIDVPFIKRTMELGANFDGLTIHPYRPVLDDAQFVKDLQECAELVKPRPVWITEMGWPTVVSHNSLEHGFPISTQRHQAELLVRAYVDAIGSGAVTNMSWYNLRDDGPDQLYFEHAMGILKHDFRLKPALRAFATMTQLLEGRTDRMVRLESGQNVEIYEFRGAEGSSPVMVVWSTDRDRRIRLRPPLGRNKTVNLMADVVIVECDGEELELELRAGVPIFLS